MLYNQISQATAPASSLTLRIGRLISALRHLGTSVPMPTDPRLLRDIGLIDEVPSDAAPETRDAAMQLLRNI